MRLRVIVHDFNGDAVQIRGKTGVVSVQAQIIAVDARQPNQCASFNDNLAFVALGISEDGCGFGTEQGEGHRQCPRCEVLCLLARSPKQCA